MIEQNIFDLDAEDKNGMKLVLAAISYRGNQAREIVVHLIRYGANSNVVDKFGRTVLMWAAQNGFTDLVRLILEKGVDNVNAQDRSGKTAFIWAAQKGYLDIFRNSFRRRRY